MPRVVVTPMKAPPTERLTELLKARAELDAHVAIERKRAREIAELRAFLAKRPTITRAVLAKYVKDLPVDRRARADKPVTSKHSGRLIQPAKGKAGIAIRKAREAKEWSRTALADKLGCHGSLIGHWEAGRGKPGPDLRAKVEKVLGIPASVFDAPAANGHAAP